MTATSATDATKFYYATFFAGLHENRPHYAAYRVDDDGATVQASRWYADPADANTEAKRLADDAGANWFGYADTSGYDHE